ncbi:MAG TPA: hypothetical protein VN879_21035, partial [Candidatus Acidoferrales bacterium]|nr:hypothetical protein [Candidatus Acidoferrales bacterium]
ESSAVSLRQSIIVAALTSAGSTRLMRLQGSLRIFAACGQDFVNGIALVNDGECFAVYRLCAGLSGSPAGTQLECGS